MWKRIKGTAPWLPLLCWSRDAFRDAALLLSNEEGALAFFVLYACLPKSNRAVFVIAKVPACSACVDPRVWKGSGERLGEPP